MNEPNSNLEHAALALPDTERADLAYKLICSLPPRPGLGVDSPQFESELERRMEAYDAGQTSADDWDAVAARIRQAIDDRSAK
jgi:putative addiction module component (TIGR02574 family)